MSVIANYFEISLLLQFNLIKIRTFSNNITNTANNTR